MNTRNRRRPHLLPGKWRKLEVRARKPREAVDGEQLQFQIAELEDYIVSSGTSAPRRRPTAAADEDLPLRFDQRQAASRERAQLILGVGLLAAALLITGAWLAYRMSVL